MKENIKLKNPFKASPQSDVISVADCAAFCVDVYNDLSDKKKRPELPVGWKRSLYSPVFEGGFYGACYEKDLGDHYNIVIAFRGTVPTSLSSINQALQIYKKNSLQIFENAKNFYIDVLEYYEPKDEEKLHNSTFAFTGHSMGGVLSDFTATNVFLCDPLPSITFDNPGSKPCIIQWCKDMWDDIELREDQINNRLFLAKENCVAYQSNVNIINTCNEQVGTTYHLNLPYEFYGSLPQPPLPLDISPLYHLNPHYVVSYSLLEQHSVESICKYLKESKPITQANYPNNLQAGYAEYLNYDSRSDYWNAYIEACWNLYPKERIWNLNNFERFSKGAVKQIKLMHEAAVSSIPKAPSLLDASILLDKANSNTKITVNTQGTTSYLGLFAKSNTNKDESKKNPINDDIDINEFVKIDNIDPVKSKKEDDSQQKPRRCLIM